MKFIDKLKEYVMKNDDFEVVNIGGSFADKKRENRADELSDVDLFIITEKKDYYLQNPKWLEFFDEKFIYFNDPISMGVGTELRIAFESGLLADIAIVNNEEFEQLKNNQIFCEKILDRGMINIKNTKGENYFKYKSIEKQKISEKALNRKINEFWIDIANIYKYIKRNDLFSAKYAFDRRITKLVIYTMEEYTKTLNNNIDVMFNGRNMSSWLDEESLKLIYEINSSIKEEEMLKSIDLAINLFENRMKKIFKYYGFEEEQENNIIIPIIKEKLNELKNIKTVVNKILTYSYGMNNNTLEKILYKKVQEAYEKKEKLNFVIPAFPGKSPNKNSCFSHLPDYTENISINSIKAFIKEINKVYKFKCTFTIIHDGHYFIKLGITRSEEELNDYINEIRKSLPRDIKSKTIYDLMGTRDFNIAYNKFAEKYMNCEKIDNNGLSNEIVFTKYEFFDKIYNVSSSKNQIQIWAKKIAKNSLLIKRAVNNLIEDIYPNSIRLSVHYQEENSKKMGFKMIPNAVNKGTPWFYVAYKSTSEKIILGKRNWKLKSKKLKNDKFGKYYSVNDKVVEEFLDGKISETVKKEKGFNR